MRKTVHGSVPPRVKPRKAGVAVHTEQNAGGELWGVAKQKGTGKAK